MRVSHFSHFSLSIFFLAASLSGPGAAISRAQATRAVAGESLQGGSIEGALVNADNGRAVEGIKVTVRETGDTAVTDRNGFYSLANLAPGTYSLSIGGDGFQGMRITDVVVQPGHTVTLSRQEVPVLGKGEPLVLDKFIVSAKDEGVVRLDQFDVRDAQEKPFTADLDIKRTIDDAQPYYIFDTETIDRSGAVNTEDFLKQRLSMNASTLTNGETAGMNTLGNTSAINLRGVGTDKTLILINGRRVAGVSLGTTDYQPDLNGIPISAIERIEVLPSSASGIYGGNAIGGVVNVILKKEYAGGEVRLSYDNFWDTDAAKRQASLTYGFSLEKGKTHVMLSASWRDTNPLLLQDGVGIYAENLAAIQSRVPTYAYSATIPWLGSLPNITPSSSRTTTLTLKNGTVVLNSRNTFVPAGTSPTTPTAELAAGLLANAGDWDFDFPLSTQSPTGLLRRIGSPARTRSLELSVDRAFSPWLELNADFSFSENKTHSVFNPITDYLLVPLSAPTNPFTTAVRVRVPDSTEVPIDTKSQNRAFTIGAVVQLPWDWTGRLDYSWSENSYYYLRYLDDPTTRDADLLSGALNPFVDTLMYPLDLKKYLSEGSYDGSNRLQVFGLHGTGPLPNLPWGQPHLTVGLERQRATAPENEIYNDYPGATSQSYRIRYFARKAITDTGYGEATIPLVKDDWLPGIHVLEAQVSGRGDRYSVNTGTYFEGTRYNLTPPFVYYGGPTLNGEPYFSRDSYTATNYTVGLRYQPVRELTIRLSRASAFLPPSPDQLVKNPYNDPYPVNITDPTTNAGATINTVSGGNPDLKPQSSKSINLGIIWEPTWHWLEGWRFDAEYYKIEQFKAIGYLTAQQIVDQEDIFPERVVRDASGTITLVDTSAVNLYRRETEGWDLSVDYSLKTPIGRFGLHAVESIILHLRNQYAQTLPEYDNVNFPSEAGAAKYKANATLDWEWKRWSAGWTARYFSSYKQYGAAGGPNSVQYGNGGVYDTTYILMGGTDTLPAQTYHDVFVGYHFGKSSNSGVSSASRGIVSKVAAGLSLQLNVRNVFDKVAPFDPYYSSNYFLSPYGGGLGGMRSYVITVKKEF